MFLSSAFRALCLGAALLTVSGEGICVINSCDDLAACASATNPVTDDTTGKTTYTIDFSACKPPSGDISWACCTNCDAVSCPLPANPDGAKKCEHVTTMSVTVDKCVESVTIKVHDGNLRGDAGVTTDGTCYGGTEGSDTNCGASHLCDVEIALEAPDCEEDECITCDGEEEYGFKAANTFYLCVKDPGTNPEDDLSNFPCPIGQQAYHEGDVIVYLGEDCLEETTIDRAHKLVDASGNPVLTSKGQEQFRDLSNFARVCVKADGTKSCIKKCDLAWGADSSMVCQGKIDNVDTLLTEDDITDGNAIEFVSPTCVLPAPERRLGGPRFW